jgi:DNA-binding response OmpR family regulator/signal transduction histidine kinase
LTEPRHTLLFVDDEPDVLDILSRTFERRFEVRTASSGAQALDILRGGGIDLLVTDQKMPEMTGIELVARAREEGLDVTAILLTAYTDPTDLIAAINQGQVYRYVTKPWDVHELMMTVRNAMEATLLRRDKDRLLGALNKRVEALNVLYEVSRQSAGDAPTYEAIIERVLTALERVLPYDCAAALVALEDGRSATLRIRCRTQVSEKGLLAVKEQVVAAHRKSSGTLLPEDRIVTHVASSAPADADAASAFDSQLTVALTAGGRPVGSLSLFSRARGAFSAGDGELLDALANQTVDAILTVRGSEEVARRRIERMVEAMADGVLLTDDRNEIVVINPAARKLLQLSEDPAEWTSRHLQESLGFYPFELVRGWEYGGAQVLREELQLFDRTVLSTVSPVAEPGGRLQGVVVVLHDVTEQKALEARKEEFVSVVSHELRTPLTSISGALDLVLNFIAGEINEKQQRYLQLAKDSTDKLNAIVDDLLDLSKLEHGRMRMQFEVVNLGDLVRAAVEKYGPSMERKRIKVEVALPPSQVRALADPSRLNQVLGNLLTNSIKFTPEEGTIRVELGDSPGAPGFVSLSVWNSGEEIAEADLERIFDKFEQAQSARTRNVRGTGLGLAICRSIAQAHGGRIWAEGCATGARFVAVLPVEPTKEVLDGLELEEPKVPSGAPRARILVIEDDPAIAWVLKALLLSRNHQVLIAQNAEEALATARRYRPDAITLDLRLPDVDGFRLAEILRHDPDTRQAPILVLSGLDQRQEAFRHGVSAFLQKPVQAQKLLASVDALLKGGARRKQGKVLLVDDDAGIRAVCEEVLSNMGFEVCGAGTLQEARRQVEEDRPDLLLLDVGLPDGDGFGFLEELKAERASSHLPVIFLSARSDTQAKVRALKLGGDDYLVKPFDALELGARVESVLRRRETGLGASPTTQLPGSGGIEREVMRRLRDREPFAFCYLDLDNLKAYNDYYGYAKADGVIRQTGDLLREILRQQGAPGDYLGHVAGDDFVLVVDPARVDAVCQRAIEAFDRIIPLYYDRQDRERGYIEAEDRYGQRRRFALMSVSVVAVLSEPGVSDHPTLAKLAADLKKRAKGIDGSVYLRSDRPEGAPVRSVAG